MPVADAVLEPRVQIVAIVTSALLFGLVIELVRRRRLAERYALLWLIVTGVILLLSVWTDLLGVAGRALGILPANFLLFAAIGFSFFLLLHFSVAISRLSNQVKNLAMEVARLDFELRATRAGQHNGAGNGDPAGAEPQRDPSRTSTSDQ